MGVGMEQAARREGCPYPRLRRLAHLWKGGQLLDQNPPPEYPAATVDFFPLDLVNTGHVAEIAHFALDILGVDKVCGTRCVLIARRLSIICTVLLRPSHGSLLSARFRPHSSGRRKRKGSRTRVHI
jgi:hypothetical protein